MITNAQYTSLFEKIASAVKAISHNPPHGRIRFYPNPDAVPDKGLIPGEFYLLLMRPKYGFANNDSDNIIERLTGGFWLLSPVKGSENFADQDQAINNCKGIARQIFALLYELRKKIIIKEFDPKHIEGYPEGPLLENCFGVFYEFTIGEPDNLRFNPLHYDMDIFNNLNFL